MSVCACFGPTTHPSWLRPTLPQQGTSAPWEPDRDDVFYTEAGQVAIVTNALSAHSDGLSLPLVLTSGTRIVGG
ncbi:MAG: hypothetical protein R2722_06415 [Tessaracoccus sp.]